MSSPPIVRGLRSVQIHGHFLHYSIVGRIFFWFSMSDKIEMTAILLKEILMAFI